MYIPPRKILPHVCSLTQLVNVLFMSVRIDVGFLKNISYVLLSVDSRGCHHCQ